MTGRLATILVLTAVALLAVVSELFAQTPLEAPAPTPCTGVNHVTWPSVNPVWDFCWTRPESSSTANGSGLELTNVKYMGVLVLARAHLPILNVKYAPNTSTPFVCGGSNFCYRDWLYQEQAFECAPVTSPGFCTGTTTPATTVCQHPGTDMGAFSGVAVEILPDRLRLTAQCQAGWYRYIPVWEFFADGRLRARFDASSTDNNCVAYDHHHHSYFRFDFDVNSTEGNYVDEVLAGGGSQRVLVERNFIDTSPARSKWRVGNAGSPYVVEVTRNPEDGAAGDTLPVPNDFPMADGWVLAYDQNELSDYSNLFTCAANLNSFDNDQNVNGADVVMWVRASAFHVGEGSSQATDCSMVGPTIRVLPTAPPNVATSFHTLAAPCRIVDTRNPAGSYGGPALQAGATRDFVLVGPCDVPPTAKSVAVNLTVTEPTAAGHLTAFPAGQGVPLASSINFSAGQTRANNAILRLSAAGAISVESVLATGSVHFILDVTGWFE